MGSQLVSSEVRYINTGFGPPQWNSVVLVVFLCKQPGRVKRYKPSSGLWFYQHACKLLYRDSFLFPVQAGRTTYLRRFPTVSLPGLVFSWNLGGPFNPLKVSHF